MLRKIFRTASLLLTALLLVVIAGCGESDEPPLSEEITITLLVEMHLLQGQREIGLEDYPSRQDVFRHYEVTEEEFDETMLYYARYPEKYKELFSKVMDTLQVERDPGYYEQFNGS